VHSCWHRFNQSFQPNHNTSPPVAFLTTQNTPSNGNWYPGTGSTNHLTADLNNLSLQTKPYNGTEQIRVGNGQGLAISHIGSSQLFSPSRIFNSLVFFMFQKLTRI
jgi:hypothetical protein